MKQMVVTLLLGLCAIGGVTAGSDAQGPDVSAMITNTRPGIVVLYSVDRRGRARSYGTGFFITRDGMLVTARHVAQGEENLLAVTQDGKKHPVAFFLGEDKNLDVSVLKIEGNEFPCLELAGDKLPKTNEWIAVVSAEDRIAPTISTGVVAEVVALPGLIAMISTTVPVRPGQSGSPLLNARGQVIGVVPYVSTRETATASPLSALRPLLDTVHTSVPVVFTQRPKTKTTKPFVVDGQFRAAVKAFRSKEWKKAEHKLKAVARRFSESPLVFLMLGFSQIQRQEIKKAEASLDKALNMSADSALAWLLKGICLTVDPKRMSQGLESVRRSIELGLPEEIELSAWESLAKTEAALGNTNNAAQALDQVTRLNPTRGLELSKELIGKGKGGNP